MCGGEACRETVEAGGLQLDARRQQQQAPGRMPGRCPPKRVEAMMLWPLRRGHWIGRWRLQLQLCQLQHRQLEPTGQPATAVPSTAAAIPAAFETRGCVLCNDHFGYWFTQPKSRTSWSDCCRSQAEGSLKIRARDRLPSSGPLRRQRSPGSNSGEPPFQQPTINQSVPAAAPLCHCDDNLEHKSKHPSF
jgi:hypothetical protein